MFHSSSFLSHVWIILVLISLLLQKTRRSFERDHDAGVYRRIPGVVYLVSGSARSSSPQVVDPQVVQLCLGHLRFCSLIPRSGALHVSHSRSVVLPIYWDWV
jgi:hypothetical protein